MVDSPDVRTGKRLLDIARGHGFVFERTGPGPDGPLRGTRDTEHHRDTIYLAGFWSPNSCSAVRRRKSPLIVADDAMVTDRVTGDALNVLNTVISRWHP